MIGPREEDELEIFESRKAIADAEFASVKTDAAVASVHRAADEIRSIVRRDGYVDRFREMLKGA